MTSWFPHIKQGENIISVQVDVHSWFRWKWPEFNRNLWAVVCSFNLYCCVDFCQKKRETYLQREQEDTFGGVLHTCKHWKSCILHWKYKIAATITLVFHLEIRALILRDKCSFSELHPRFVQETIENSVAVGTWVNGFGGFTTGKTSNRIIINVVLLCITLPSFTVVDSDNRCEPFAKAKVYKCSVRNFDK